VLLPIGIYGIFLYLLSNEKDVVHMNVIDRYIGTYWHLYIQFMAFNLLILPTCKHDACYNLLEVDDARPYAFISE
jgi:hypothetical protein